MRLILDEQVFQSLHPFSCVCDESARVVTTGNALAKLFPRLHSGERLWDHLRLIQPSIVARFDHLGKLAGEPLVITGQKQEGLTLRGHVVHIPNPPERFLFALRPSASDAYKIAESGINFSDFEIGDPVYDFILYIRNLELANQKLNAAIHALELDSQLSATLREIAGAFHTEESESRVYARCLELVCNLLAWNIGNVVTVDPKTLVLTSTSVWCAREYVVNQDVSDIASSIQAVSIEEIPIAARTGERVVWEPNYAVERGFPRAEILSSHGISVAVWVPIVVDGHVVAILEFFGGREHASSDKKAHFFELLSRQVSQAIEHLRMHETERSRIAALAQAAKMATLGQLAAGIAHEITNPISTISLISAILGRSATRGQLTKELVETQVARLDSCTGRIGKILVGLRSFSRDASREPMRSQSLGAIVAETLDLCSAGFSAKGISFTCDPVPPTWMVQCRNSQLSQVLLNILCNAQDAALDTADRWVRLEASESDEWYEVSVIDSGKGVPKEIRDRIMIPFFTTKPAGKGTGLGLSISSNIMVDHGGSLYLDESSPNTRFVMRVPKSPVGAVDKAA